MERQRIVDQLKDSGRLKALCAEKLPEAIERVLDLLWATLSGGGTIFFCGNGGSAADAQHIAAELVGRFGRERSALAALALTTDTSILTAVGNDYGFEEVFARQIEALGNPGDCLVCISTSGESANLIQAAKVARQQGIKVVGLLGRGGGRLKGLVDEAVVVPSDSVPRIQEIHITIGHIWCDLLEERLAAQARQGQHGG